MAGGRPWVGVLAVAALLTGCTGAARPASPSDGAAPSGTSPTASTSWAHEAQEWLAAFDAASAFEHADASGSSEGPSAQARFYAVNVEFDSSDLAGFHKTGRWNVLAVAESYAHSSTGLTSGPAYLGTAGAVLTRTLSFEGALGYLLELDVGIDGIERMAHAQNYWLLADPDLSDEAAAATQSAADRLAARYVRAWSQADPTALAELYGTEATLLDTLHGVALTGGATIAAWADQHGEPIEPDLLGEVFSPAVMTSAGRYDAATLPAAFFTRDALVAPLESEPDVVWLLVHSSAPCPGASAVRLTLDDTGKVSAEQRFHQVSSERACTARDDLADGWWTGRGLPLPVGEQVTGHIDTPFGSVELRGGTAAMAGMAEEALDAFAKAGLADSWVTSIVFNPYSPACAHQDGGTTWDGHHTVLLVCTDGSEILDTAPECDEAITGSCVRFVDDVRHVLLHEIAHAWLVAHTGFTERAAFVHAVGLANWDLAGTPWELQGQEWAAETLAWAVGGEPQTPVRIDSPPCAVLAAGYVALTGKSAPVRCG